jgi:hypothetical protein
MTRALPLHDPARTPSSAAADRAARRARYPHMTPTEILREMPAGELQRNTRRGAPLVIAETQRRGCVAMYIPPDRDLDIGV